MRELKKVCENCDFACYDFSVSAGVVDCECPGITEDFIEEHYTNGKPDCPFWVEANGEYSNPSSLTGYLNKTRKVLKDNNIYADVWKRTLDDVDYIAVYINMGDWKHEHLRAKLILEKIGLVHVNEQIEEKTDGDSYSATHYFVVKNVEDLQIETAECPKQVYYYIDWESVRSLCIQNKWYTSGNNSSYSKLQKYCESTRDLHGSVEDCAYTVALDICKHSKFDVDDDMTYHVMMKIIDKATKSFIIY